MPVGEQGSAGVKVTAVVEDASPMKMIYDPKHPMANEQGYVAMPNVNVVEEMVNMISSSRSYQNNVEVMNTSKSLMLTTQLKNQDPLNPMDNAQITSQMAQLSTVTGIDKLNETLQALSDSMAM